MFLVAFMKEKGVICLFVNIPFILNFLRGINGSGLNTVRRN